jgi:hypothetical protein
MGAQDNAVIALRIILDLHKTYRLLAADRGG